MNIVQAGAYVKVKRNITMKEVFKDLPRGYWRNIHGELKKIVEMDMDYLRNVKHFLEKKRWTSRYFRQMDGPVPVPTEIEYIMKLLEVNTEIKKRVQRRRDGNPQKGS